MQSQGRRKENNSGEAIEGGEHVPIPLPLRSKELALATLVNSETQSVLLEASIILRF